MGVRYDYFAAADDAGALARLHGDLGAVDDEFGLTGLKGADPELVLGPVEAVLTGRSVAEVEDDPRFVHLISDPQAEDRYLVTLTGTLRDALAGARPEQLEQTATTVVSGPEDSAGWDADLLADFLQRLAELSRHARVPHQQLYCLISL
ncbi:hypothetical protein ACWGDT_01245 [Streptomyces avermitilis]